MDKQKLQEMLQEEIWDKIAGKWSEFRKNPLPEVIEFLKEQTGNVLDLGCGSGRHFIKDDKISIIGVDFSKEMLKIAEQKAKNLNIKLVKAPCDKLPFEDNFFDSAIFIRTLHCLPSKKERRESLKELSRVLKPKAQAFIQVWGKNHERIKHKSGGGNVPWTINGKKLHRYYYIYNKEDLENLLKKISFKIIKIWEDLNISVIVEK